VSRKREEQRYGEWVSVIHEREVALKDRVNDWNKYLRHYRMDLTEQESPPNDSVWLNLFFTLSRIILPSIYYRNPDILVTPLRSTPLTYATLLEKLINSQFRTMGFEREGRRAVFDALICGVSFIKLGYGPALQGKARSRTDEEWFFEGESAFDEEEEPKPNDLSWEADSRLTGWNPFAIRISPKLFLIDPLATSMEDARWVCHLVIKDVNQIRKSPLYPRGLTKGIEGNMTVLGDTALNEVHGGVSGRYYGSGALPKPTPYSNLVVLYELWDRETNKLMVLDSHNMTVGTKKFLREDESPYDMDGFPFEALVFNQDTETPYGVSDAATWYNPMITLNLLNSMHYNHVKRFHRKYLVEKGALGVDEMSKLEAPIDGAVIEVNGPPAAKVEALMDAQISPDLYNLRTVLRDEMTAASGVTEQRRGGQEKARTATEASIIEQQARIRDSDRLYLVGDLVERVAKKLLSLDRQFLQIDQVDFLVGPEMSAFWQEVGPDVLKAQVDVRVRVGSSGFMSREVRTKQLIDLLNVAKGAVDEMGRPILNMRALIERIAEGLEVDDYRSLMIPQQPVDPQQLALQQMLSGGAQGGSGQQSPNLRSGGSNLGSMLSSIQNMGVRRTPNPTQGMN